MLLCLGFQGISFHSAANLAQFLVDVGWIGCALYQATSKWLQGFFLSNILIFIYFFKWETIETHAREILTLTILSKGTVHTY